MQIAARLKADGYDVLTARDAGLLGASDEQHLTYAAEQGFILLTHDIQDYRTIAIKWAAQGRPHAGIVYCSQNSPAVVSDWIRRLFELYSSDDLRTVTIGLPVD